MNLHLGLARTWLCALLAVMTASCAVAQPAKPASAAPRPNIVLVVADDLGYGDVGFNGQEHIRTPTLDRMAAEGVVLEQFYAGSPVCMPSRATLLTGKHLGNTFNRGNPRWTFQEGAYNLGPDEVTVAEELKRAGYATAVFGKWGLAEFGDDANLPTRRGFDTFFGYRTHGAAHHYYPKELQDGETVMPLPENKTRQKQGQYSHDMFTERTLAWLDGQGERPFFLVVNFTIPHYELTVPADSKEPYRDAGFEPRRMRPGHYFHDRDGNVTYAAMVSRMDRDLGRILEKVEAMGAGENTLVIFTSDNGPEYEKEDGFFNSNGPLRGGKRDLYEGGIRVPTVAWWPGTAPAGVRSSHPSGFWDLLPTFAELAGVSPSREVDGVSLAPTLTGRADQQAEHEWLYWEFNEWQGPIQAVRKGDWKGVRFLGKPVEVYNLAQDVGETTNVAADHPGVAAELERILDTARSEHPAFPLEWHPRARNRN